MEEVYAATVYAEARGEDEDGQTWVARVIFNRAKHNPKQIKDVCLAPYQFECWNNKSSIEIREPAAFHRAMRIIHNVLNSDPRNDPTHNCKHYNNPSDRNEQDQEWPRKASRSRQLGNHRFYWFDE
jgi:spore germination cell wall hydrolase CwlJ-like protein